jgi:hypothetical protein
MAKKDKREPTGTYLTYLKETNRLTVVFSLTQGDTVEEWHSNRVTLLRSLDSGEIVGVIVENLSDLLGLPDEISDKKVFE